MWEDLMRDGFQSPVRGDPNVSFNVVKLSLALVYSLMCERVSGCFSLPKYRPWKSPLLNLPPDLEQMKLHFLQRQISSLLTEREISVSSPAVSMIPGPNRSSYSWQSRKEAQEASPRKQPATKRKALGPNAFIPWSQGNNSYMKCVTAAQLLHDTQKAVKTRQPSVLPQHSTFKAGLLCDLICVDLFYNMLVFSYIKWK